VIPSAAGPGRLFWTLGEIGRCRAGEFDGDGTYVQRTS
jgi:hypothetical protein